MSWNMESQGCYPPPVMHFDLLHVSLSRLAGAHGALTCLSVHWDSSPLLSLCVHGNYEVNITMFRLGMVGCIPHKCPRFVGAVATDCLTTCSLFARLLLRLVFSFYGSVPSCAPPFFPLVSTPIRPLDTAACVPYCLWWICLLPLHPSKRAEAESLAWASVILAVPAFCIVWSMSPCTAPTMADWCCTQSPEVLAS
jgi:hypothetical protein